MSARLVVLGSPVGHSRSPAIHRAAMGALGIAGSYGAADVDARGMQDAAESVRKGALLGASITMPHKALAAALADGRTAVVERLGVANTWWAEGGRLFADATDGAGVRFAWGRGDLPAQGAVRILGAGGAAAAAALELSSTHDVAVCSRDPERSGALAERIGCRSTKWGTTVDDEAVVNATPLGMAGEPLPDWAVAGSSGLLEMVYAAGSTPTEERLRARGIPVATGLDMLVGQAVPAFRRWFGVDPPLEAMLGAAKDSSAP